MALRIKSFSHPLVSQMVCLVAKMVHLMICGWFIAVNINMTISCANVINSNAKVTNSIANGTNSIANVMNSIVKETNSTLNETKSIAKVTNSIAKTYKNASNNYIRKLRKFNTIAMTQVRIKCSHVITASVQPPLFHSFFFLSMMHTLIPNFHYAIYLFAIT